MSNVLFDGNMLAGNSTAARSSSTNTADSNSTGIRIKSGNDRGGVVSNIQYSNSCFQNHATEIVFSPFTTPPLERSTQFQEHSDAKPLLPYGGYGGVYGGNNNGTVNPLGVTLDNVSFATLAVVRLSPAPAPTNVALT